MEKNDWFVYQNWDNEILYAKNLSESEVDSTMKELDNLIKSETCGNGCACAGRISEPSDYQVCKRLDLIK